MIVVNRGKLTMEGSAFGTFDMLVPLGGGRFRVGEGPFGLLFPPPKSGAPQELHGLPEPNKVLARVTAPVYSAMELRAYAHEYRSDELGVSFTIAVLPGGHLAVLRPRSDPMQLTALKRDTFFSSLSDGAGTLTFARAASGDVTGFMITGGTPRRLVFTSVGPPPSTGK